MGEKKKLTVDIGSTPLINYVDVDILSYMEGRQIVLFTGGCDSTLLLYEMAEKYSTRLKPIYAVSFKSQFIHNDKEKKEREARQKILQKIKDDGYHVKSVVIETKYNEGVLNGVPNGVVQPFLWLSKIIFHLKNCDTVYTGFLDSESFNTCKDKFESIFSLYKDALGLNDTYILHPYLRRKKEDVIRRLKYLDLYDLVWYCESPDEDNGEIEPCGDKCHCCVYHNKSLLNMFMSGEEWVYDYLPESYKEKLVKK